MQVKERLEGYLAGQGTVDGFKPLSHGWETEVYGFYQDGAPTVLRLYQGQNVAVRAETEFRMMRHLGRLGYPVPRVDRYEADPAIFGGPFLLMEGIEGHPLVDHLRESRMETVEKLCRLMADLHHLDWRSFIGPDAVWPDLETARGTFANRFWLDLCQSLDLSGPVQPLFDWLEEHGKSVSFRNAPVHSDLHFENVLVRADGSPVVIDWGSTGIADPRCDLAYVYMLMTTQGAAALGEEIRSTYEAMAGPQADWDYFVSWALIRRLVVMLIVLVRGSAAIGLRPGLEGQLHQNIGYLQQVASLVSERTGVRLTEVDLLLRG